MKKLMNFMLLMALLLFLYSCIDCKYSYEPEMPKEDLPIEEVNVIVTTGDVYDISTTSAIIKGSVENVDSVRGVARIGVMYSTDPNVSEHSTHIFTYSEEKQSGEFSFPIRDLEPGTTYYYRSCVRIDYTESDYYYGEIKSFRTKEEKTVTVSTGVATDITSTSAVISGRVENLGEENSNVEIGVVYGINTALNISNGTFISSGRNVNGEYSVTVTGLKSETTYYYCSCVIIGDKCYYGEIKSFITQESPGNGGNIETEEFSIKGVAFSMIAVEGGAFVMGATIEQGSDAYDDEYPLHQVTLSDYYIGKYEVTQGLWEAVMSYTGECADGSSIISYEWGIWLGDSYPTSTYGVGADYPAYYVSYEDIVDIFLPRLNKITGKTFRLPTEAEWEYAARGGNKSNGYKYSGSNNIDDVAWYTSNSSSKTHPVGTKQPNELGIYDMSGNVYEWCSDWYGSYSSSSQTNPVGPTSGSRRVQRGGGWSDSAGFCRVSIRDNFTPSDRIINFGFRLVLVP